MAHQEDLRDTRRRGLLSVLAVAPILFLTRYCFAYGKDQSGFPDGHDAVQSAPDSHKVIFENELVRVLQVTVPPPGSTIPMHHHRWPSFFLDWDTGGGTPHIRYHRPGGIVRDIPEHDAPLHLGAWGVRWMMPEPMHAIEVVSKPPRAATSPKGPPSLRIEIKCG